MELWKLFLEMWYVLIGFLLMATAFIGYRNVQDNRKYGVFAFWTILAILFAVGPVIPDAINGVLVISLGLLSAFKLVNITDIEQISQQFRDEASNQIGNWIFIPSVLIALGAFAISSLLPFVAKGALTPTEMGFVGIGLSSLIGMTSLLLITRAPVKYVASDGARLVRTMGSTAILPQLLGALGTIFTAAGLGDVISKLVGSYVPEGSLLLGVVAYCVGMALFSMIMGNGFAAFTVITVGIGIPFVIAQGGNPIVVATLGMTAGFTGTLMTPMAANFNIVPATLLETKNPYAVIKYQTPVALIMLAAHIILMYTFAF